MTSRAKCGRQSRKLDWHTLMRSEFPSFRCNFSVSLSSFTWQGDAHDIFWSWRSCLWPCRPKPYNSDIFVVRTTTMFWGRVSFVILEWSAQEKWKLAHEFLHRDTAPAHTARLTQECLRELNVDVLPHPPYSPDNASCDFWIFSTAKQSLRGQKFSSEEALNTAVKVKLR